MVMVIVGVVRVEMTIVVKGVLVLMSVNSGGGKGKRGDVDNGEFR